MNFLEISRNFVEISRKLLEHSRTFLGMSRKFQRNSKNFPNECAFVLFFVAPSLLQKVPKVVGVKTPKPLPGHFPAVRKFLG